MEFPFGSLYVSLSFTNQLTGIFRSSNINPQSVHIAPGVATVTHDFIFSARGSIVCVCQSEVFGRENNEPLLILTLNIASVIQALRKFLSYSYDFASPN